MNIFTFTGNLGKDAEQRFTAGKDSIVNFSVAVKAGYGDKATTNWVRCTMWGKRGESLLSYLKKGTLVGVSGEMSTNTYTNKEGVATTTVEVRVGDVTLLGSRPSSGGETKSATPKSAPSEPSEDFEDDIPF